jgi:hypothetical protein
MIFEDNTLCCITMVRAPGHHLSAGVVEDDHTKGGHLLEGEELAYLELMGDGEARTPLVDECVIAFSRCSHPPVPSSVAADDDVGRDLPEPLDESFRDQELAEGGLEDDGPELVWPYLVLEVAAVSWPSTTLLQRSLVGNLSS